MSNESNEELKNLDPLPSPIKWYLFSVTSAITGSINGPNIDWLKSEAAMIHYFGLGFIQLKLKDPSVRIHFYTKLLPPIVAEEDIHNHRYGFKSYIIKGEFTQELFLPVRVTDTDQEDSSYVIEKESCKEGQTADVYGYCESFKSIHKAKYAKNSNYHLDHETFHRVSSTDAITLLHREDYKKDAALVARPIGGTKVCPFSQKIEEPRLWEIVEECLKT